MSDDIFDPEQMKLMEKENMEKLKEKCILEYEANLKKVIFFNGFLMYKSFYFD